MTEAWMDLLEAMDGIAYVTRPDGRILAYGRRRWDEFAAANGGEALLDPMAVIGRNLFDCIAGEPVKHAYRQWIDAVLQAEANHPATFAYRCDAPSARRELRMAISRVEVGAGAEPAVLFQSVVLDATARPPLNIYDVEALVRDARSRLALPMVTMCSFCQRLRWPPGTSDNGPAEWVEAEMYYARGGQSDVAVSHGICQDCLPAAILAA